MSALRLRAFTRSRSHHTCFHFAHSFSHQSWTGSIELLRCSCLPAKGSISEGIWFHGRYTNLSTTSSPTTHHSLKLYPKVRVRQWKGISGFCFLVHTQISWSLSPKASGDAINSNQYVFCVFVGVLRRILDCMCGESVFRSFGEVIRSVQEICGLRSWWFRVQDDGCGILFLLGAPRSVVEGVTCWKRLCEFWSRMEALKAETLWFFYFCASGARFRYERIWLERRLCRYVAGIWGQERIYGISEVLLNDSGMYLNQVNS